MMLVKQRRATHVLVWVLLACMGSGCDDLEPGLFPGFDEEAPPTPDLGLNRRTLTGRNGFDLVNLRDGEVVWPEDDSEVDAESPSFDAEKAREIVQRNDRLLRQLEECLLLPEFLIPEVKRGEYLVPALLGWRSLAYLVATRTRVRRESGDLEGSLKDALQLVRLGHRIEEGQGPMLHFLVGCAVKTIGLRHIREAVLGNGLAASSLSSLIEDLAPLGSSRAGLRDSLAVEHQIARDAILALPRGSEGDGFLQRLLVLPPFLKVHQTTRLLGEDVRTILRGLKVPTRHRQFTGAEARYQCRKRLDAFLANGSGRTVLREVVSDLEKGVREADREDFALSVTRVLAALRLHQMLTGSLPESLEDLVPDFVKEVPRDPFDGDPLRYSKARRIVYSVGQDFEDAGGSTEEDFNDAFADPNEPTLRLGF